MWLQGTEMTPRLVGQAPHCGTRAISGRLLAPLGTDPIASCSQVAEATLQPAHTSCSSAHFMLLQLSKRCPSRASCLQRLERALSPRRCSQQLFRCSSHGAGHGDGCRDISRAAQLDPHFCPRLKDFGKAQEAIFFFQEGLDTSRNDAEQVDFVHTTGVSATFPLAPSLHGEDTLLAFSGSLSVLLPKLQLSRANTTAQQEHAPCLLHRGKGCSSLTTCHGIRRGTGTCLSRSGTRR